MCERSVDRAFGESRCISDCAHTGADQSPLVSCSLAVKVHVNHKRGGLLIVPDQVAHQHIQEVIVDGNGAFETRHTGRMKEEVNSADYTDKRTAVSAVEMR